MQMASVRKDPHHTVQHLGKKGTEQSRRSRTGVCGEVTAPVRNSKAVGEHARHTRPRLVEIRLRAGCSGNTL